MIKFFLLLPISILGTIVTLFAAYTNQYASWPFPLMWLGGFTTMVLISILRKAK